MAKGSQLSQLKSALNQAGLSRQSSSKKRKRSTVSLREHDKEKKEQKLKEIQTKLNPFEVKINKLKHDVGGRKLKGVTGKPQQSKQAGIEQRKKSLLKEYELKNHAGAIIDRRFGENDPTMTPEERMLERFTKERQRTARGSAFNLEDEDDLTHYGQSLSKMDDFEEAGLGLDDEDESDDGKIDKDTVRKVHFGGFGDEESGGEESDRKKSKAEVMAEVIAKSKQHKYERQMQKQQDADARHELDQQLDDIRGLLFGGDASDPISSKLTEENKDEDKGYDVLVRELALDKKAKPKDRTKTEEELALETKEALEKAERKRLKRMMGEEDGSNSEEDGPSAKKKARRQAGADDLEDDFQDDEDTPWGRLGAGLDADMASNIEWGDNSEGRGSETGSKDDEGDNSDEESETSEAESDEDETDHEERRRRAEPTKHSESGNKELPFTFPCPESIDEFLSVVEGLRDEDIPTVVQRIRALYHPSLAMENKFKLQTLTGVLIDYIIHITSPPSPNFMIIPILVPHLHSLTKSYPIESATHFISKLKLMQKNLTRGLSKGSTTISAKTWPGTSELAFLWIISYVWPTSDMNHVVISPARLLIGSYLSLCRIRCPWDLVSGLFLSSLILRYEEESKRFVPEALNLVINALLHLAPHQFSNAESVPGTFPCPDLNSPASKSLRITKKLARGLEPRPANLIEMMSRREFTDEQSKVDLLMATLELLGRFADMHKGLEGFIELFEPALEIAEGLDFDWASSTLKSKLNTTKASCSRLLKFARQSRQPLTLQAHKPIPIATYIPKFESSSSSYLRKNDPDYERAQTSKLRYQYKQEQKGAIRELRKDARFLSAVKLKEQMDKDRSYSERMNKVFSTLESERAEQKKMDKEKVKEKKRAGRK